MDEIVTWIRRWEVFFVDGGAWLFKVRGGKIIKNKNKNKNKTKTKTQTKTRKQKNLGNEIAAKTMKQEGDVA